MYPGPHFHPSCKKQAASFSETGNIPYHFFPQNVPRKFVKPKGKAKPKSRDKIVLLNQVQICTDLCVSHPFVREMIISPSSAITYSAYYLYKKNAPIFRELETDVNDFSIATCRLWSLLLQWVQSSRGRTTVFSGWGSRDHYPTRGPILTENVDAFI